VLLRLDCIDRWKLLFSYRSFFCALGPFIKGIPMSILLHSIVGGADTKALFRCEFFLISVR